jgi:hypothetical protein
MQEECHSGCTIEGRMRLLYQREEEVKREQSKRKIHSINSSKAQIKFKFFRKKKFKKTLIWKIVFSFSKNTSVSSLPLPLFSPVACKGKASQARHKRKVRGQRPS